MAVTSVSIILTVWVLKLHHCCPHQKSVPPWLRQSVLVHLARIVHYTPWPSVRRPSYCMFKQLCKRRTRKSGSRERKHQRKEDRVESFMRIVREISAEQSWTHAEERDTFDVPNMQSSKPSSPNRCMKLNCNNEFTPHPAKHNIDSNSYPQNTLNLYPPKSKDQCSQFTISEATSLSRDCSFKELVSIPEDNNFACTSLSVYSSSCERRGSVEDAFTEAIELLTPTTNKQSVPYEEPLLVNITPHVRVRRSSVERKRLVLVDEMLRHLKLLISKKEEDDNATDIVGEWRHVASVLDRVLFFIFLFTTTVITLVMMIIIPVWVQFSS